VLGFGPEIEVLEPAELREKVIKLAEGVVALYSRHPECLAATGL
jgi:predicted DNA-binding transcriptional regulator YafY